MMSKAILSRNILRMTSDRNCLAKHRYCQSSWSTKDVDLSNHFCYEFCHSAFCFRITSHPSTKHVFSLSLCCYEIMRCFFQMVFWQNILIKLQHVIKINQSWRLKVFWLQKWLDAWKWHEATKQFWTHASWNWTTHHTAKF